jgi:serine protease Do
MSSKEIMTKTVRRSFWSIMIVITLLSTAERLSAQRIDVDAQRSQLYAELAREAQQSSNFNVIRRLVKTVAPTVAHIEAKKKKKTARVSSNSNTKPTFIEEAGSGVVIRHRGRLFVLTNYHVIESSAKADIRIQIDGQLMQPTALRHDPETDLSVMFLERTDLPSARLGNSSEVEIGDFVVAIGSPFGLSHSVSYGIVSAKQRSDLELGPNGVRYQDFFQTDAAINPGNSGGPLLNMRGEVVAINTAIASNSGGSDGIGFSIPIKMAMRVATDLIEYNRVRRGFLGVSLDARYDTRKALELGVGKSYGAMVSAVTPGSPAQSADFRIGDVILEFDGQRVKNDSHLVTLVSVTEIGSKVPAVVFRQGSTLNINVAVRDRGQSQ